MSVPDDECHGNALNYISASLSTMPMLRFELFQLCHGKTVKMFLYFGGRLKLMFSMKNVDIFIL
jgi:hypothetical protein